MTEQIDQEKGISERDAASEGNYRRIQPEPFEPSAGSRRAGNLAPKLLGLATFLVLFGLAAAAWYLFTGTPVLIQTTPQAETLDVEGGIWNVQLGERWLLRPGEFEVQANKAGYYPLRESISVTSASDQEFIFELIKLPGYLNVESPITDPVALWVDGESVGQLPIKRLELRPGEYELVARSPRYLESRQMLEVAGGGEEQSLIMSLEPAWSDVQIITEPVGATVYVDQQNVGQTPLTTPIMQGEREVLVRLDGYKPWQQTLSVNAGEARQLPLIELIVADALVQVSSQPNGATVMVNGTYQGQTPIELALPPDETYRLQLNKTGYRGTERSVAVAQGDNKEISIPLQPVLGRVRVVGGPEGAEIVVNGTVRGSTGDTLALAAFPQRIVVRKPGYQEFITTVTPTPDHEQEIRVAMLSDAEVRAQKTPEIWRAKNGYTLKLIQPSGIFRLGSGRREQGRRANEFLRQVELKRPYYLGTHEVTNQQFAEFRAEHDSGVVGKSTLSLKTQPVVRISWNEAAQFCNWLSEKEGLPLAYAADASGNMRAVEPLNTGYRLPTEAEWAVVARYHANSSTQPTRYPWGKSMPPAADSGNYAGREATGLVNQPLSIYQDAHAASAIVGSFGPDALGFYDLGGNASEWMHDVYVIHPGTLGSIEVDPTGVASGEAHVVRGSSWHSGTITELRWAYREEGLEPADDIGFRVARYAE